MNKLRFDIKPMANPFPTDPRAAFEVWGDFSVYVSSYGKRVLLLRMQWHLEDLAEWFAENYDALRHDKFSVLGEEPLSGESLAQADERFRNRYSADDEQVTMEEFDHWYDALFEYGNHSLRVALPGTRVPDIIIGMNNGVGEISFIGDADKEKYPQNAASYANLREWSYPFEMDNFLTDTRQRLQQFLREWLATAENPAARARVEGILEKLQRTPDIVGARPR